MTPKYIFFFLGWYFLLLLEMSFLRHFPLGLFSYAPLIFLLIFLTLSETSHKYGSLIFAFVAGLALDAFSERLFGFSAILLLLFVFLLRTIIKFYVRVPIL